MTDFITDEMVEAAVRGWFKKDATWDDRVPEGDMAIYKEDMRAALVAAMRAAWRPISEMPKDGTRVLAFGGILEDVAECRYSQDGKCWVTDPYVIYEDERPSRHPTRWQPLPPPPAKEGV